MGGSRRLRALHAGTWQRDWMHAARAADVELCATVTRQRRQGGQHSQRRRASRHTHSGTLALWARARLHGRGRVLKQLQRLAARRGGGCIGGCSAEWLHRDGRCSSRQASQRGRRAGVAARAGPPAQRREAMAWAGRTAQPAWATGAGRAARPGALLCFGAASGLLLCRIPFYMLKRDYEHFSRALLSSPLTSSTPRPPRARRPSPPPSTSPVERCGRARSRCPPPEP